VVVPSFLKTVLRLDRLAEVVPGLMPSSAVTVTCRGRQVTYSMHVEKRER
jgi:hypothetical protein